MDEEEDLVVVDQIDEATGNLVQVPVAESEADLEIAQGTAIPVTDQNSEAIRQMQRETALQRQMPGGIDAAAQAATLGGLDALSFGFGQRLLQSASPGGAEIAQRIRDENPLATTSGFIAGVVLPALLSGGTSVGAQALRVGTVGGLGRAAGQFLERALVQRLGSRTAARLVAGAGEGALSGMLTSAVQSNTQLEPIDAEHLMADGLFGAALGLGVGGAVSAVERGLSTSALAARQGQELARRGFTQLAEETPVAGLLPESTSVPGSTIDALLRDIESFSPATAQRINNLAQASSFDDFVVQAIRESDDMARQIAQGGEDAAELGAARVRILEAIDDASSTTPQTRASIPEAPQAAQAADDIPGVGSTADDVIDGEVVQGADEFRAPPGRVHNTRSPLEEFADALGAGAARRVFDFAAGAVGLSLGGLPGIVAGRMAAPVVRRVLQHTARQVSQIRFEEGLRRVGASLNRSNLQSGGVALSTATLTAARSVEKREAEYEQITSQLRDYQANPAALQERLSNTLGHANETDPGLALNSMGVAVRGVQHLVENMPPQARMTPFDHLGRTPPSRAQMNDYLDRYSMIEDPLSVFDHIENRTLSRAHIEAMAAVYPLLLAQTRQRVSELLANLTEMPSYQDRLILGQLFQFPSDPTLSGDFIAAIQNTYAQTQQQRQQAPQRAGGSSMSMSIASNTQSESVEIRTSP